MNKKYFWSLLSIMMVAMLSFGFVSCGGDDDDEISNEKKEGPNNEQNNEPDNGTVKGEVAEAVDLGLSVKWASWNVGASRPEEVGNYYAWGETKPKEYYTYNNWRWKGQITKSSSKNIMGSNYDAATVNWGDGWRMPHIVEFMELRGNCTWGTAERNGVPGFLVVGPNGNAIFLPKGGHMTTEVVGVGAAQFWSETCGEVKVDKKTYKGFMGFSNTGIWEWRYWEMEDGSCGFPVRAVKD